MNKISILAAGLLASAALTGAPAGGVTSSFGFHEASSHE
jgi:hypothetical protein